MKTFSTQEKNGISVAIALASGGPCGEVFPELFLPGNALIKVAELFLDLSHEAIPLDGANTMYEVCFTDGRSPRVLAVFSAS